MEEKRAVKGRTAWGLLLHTQATVLRLLEQKLQEARGLPLTWCDVLAHLAAAPSGGLRMQTLAESVILSRSGITRLVDRMEQAGLVERRPCPHDRRGAYAVITKQGRSALARAEPVLCQAVWEHFTQHLDDADVHALQTALGKVSKAEGGRPACIPTPH